MKGTRSYYSRGTTQINAKLLRSLVSLTQIYDRNYFHSFLQLHKGEFVNLQEQFTPATASLNLNKFITNPSHRRLLIYIEF